MSICFTFRFRLIVLFNIFLYSLDKHLIHTHAHFRSNSFQFFTLSLWNTNLDVIKVADYLIDLGPEGGDKGGEIVCEGTPEEVAACEKSYTGQFLKKMLGKR